MFRMNCKNNSTDNHSIFNYFFPTVLWGVKASPFVQKVMVALAEKEIPYRHEEILPKSLLIATKQAIPENFEKNNPLGKIPALQIGEFWITDSAVIAGYLDKKFATGNRIYPINPENYSRALWFEHYSDSELTNVAYRKIFVECVIKPKILNIEPNLELVEHAQKNELPAILNYLDQAVTHFDWIAGDEFSMADVAIATQLLALKNSDFQIGNWGYLSQYLTNVISRPSFKQLVSDSIK